MARAAVARAPGSTCPSWCARCELGVLDGWHVSAPVAVIEPEPGADEGRVVVALERWDFRQLELNRGPGRWLHDDVRVRVTLEPVTEAVGEVSYSAATTRRVAEALLGAARLADELA